MRLLSSTLTASALGLITLAMFAGPSGCGNNLQSPYIPAERFPAAYAQALCASLQHCCAENKVAYNYDQCTAGWKALVQTRFDDPNSAALANYDPKAATNCVAQVNLAATVSCAPVPASISAARATCQSIFAGKKVAGADCASDPECAPQDGAIVRCLPKDPAAGPDAGGQLPLSHPIAPLGLHPLGAGVCVATPIPQGGAPCTPAGSGACNGDPTQFCDPVSRTCIPRADVAGPCSPLIVDSCKGGAYCVASGPSAGLCATAQPQGSPCTSSVECDITTVCDGSACVARKQPTASCAADAECSVNACDPTSKTCLANVIATTAACTGVGP
jgi:hypothetical protein